MDALTLTGHKLGGPVGAGALVLGRDVDCAPLLHGGGQEREVRSGTLNTAAIVGLAVATEAAVAARPETAARVAALRDELVAGVLAAVPDAVLSGDPVDRLPGNAHFAFPGCEGDSLLMLLDARGVECSTGSACSAGVAAAQPRAARDGRSTREHARGSLRFSLGHSSTGPTWTRCSTRCRPRSSGPRRGGPARRRPMRVLAAVSGGVDSAVAMARAVDAGHDVTAVHLALARNPASTRTGARGCCTLEDARDARRAADVLGVPFYVWDLAERFHADVVADFVAEYAAGRTPNPCLRCNEKIKFAAVLDRALALGFDAVVTGHHARLVRRRAAALGRPGQGPVVRAGRADRATSWRTRCSRWAARPRPRCGPRPRARGLRRGRQAGLARRLLHRRRRHPRLPAPGARRPARARWSTPRPAPRSAGTTARTGSRSGSGAGLGLDRPGGAPRYVLVDRAGRRHRHGRAGRRCWTSAR